MFLLIAETICDHEWMNEWRDGRTDRLLKKKQNMMNPTWIIFDEVKVLTLDNINVLLLLLLLLLDAN